MTSYALVFALSLAFVTLFGSALKSIRRKSPPGPARHFWRGNAGQIPAVEPWKQYRTWAEQFGPIIYLRLYKRKLIILNSLKTATDLLESRASIYSDRPMSWSYSELIGRKLAVFNISIHHPRFKVYRKMLQSELGSRAASGYLPILEEQSRALLRDIAHDPDQFLLHLRKNAGAVILKFAYGYTVEGRNDPFVDTIEQSFKTHAQITRPGRWLVDTLPILRFVPDWFPFASFKREAAAYKLEFSRVDAAPHVWCKQQLESGMYLESFTSRHLRPESRHVLDAEEEDVIKWCSSAIYAGGADTIVTAMSSFFLLMSMNTEVQGRAQAEIADVLGTALPTANDESRLPYVEAIMKETLRWAPPASLGLPHRLTQDDVYNSMHIPKGTVAYANIWAIAHEEQLYDDPFEFRPERHISLPNQEAQLDPRKYVFGFGRRICPGAQFAEKSLFLNMACILASFNIRKARDCNGQDVEPAVIFGPGVTNHPSPFTCRISPRDRVLVDSF